MACCCAQPPTETERIIEPASSAYVSPDTKVTPPPQQALPAKEPLAPEPSAPPAVETNEAPAAAPAQPAIKQFIVKLKKEQGDVLGLKMDLGDRFYCCVSAVTPGGIIEAYNEQAAEGTRIEVGDYIMSVNKFGDSNDGMVKLLKEENSLEISIKKCFRMTLKINRNNQQLGLHIAFQGDKEHLVIQKITAGAVQDYNEMNDRAEQVAQYSRIIGVNGFSGKSDELYKRLHDKTLDPLELELSCCALFTIDREMA